MSLFCARNLGIVAIFAASTAITANAAVYTTPSGLLTAPNAGTVGDPIVADTWLRENVRNGASIGITTNFPRNNDGSGYLNLGPNGGSGKADWEFYPTGTFGTVANLTALSYDWYRTSASTVASHLHPVIRLIVDRDGVNPGTSGDISYLIFERAYNPSTSAVPTDAWTTEAIGNATNLWISQPGQGIEEVYNRTLADYKAGTYTPTAGWAAITGNSVIIGVSMGIGSGWNGTFEGAVDNVNLTRAGAAAFSANMEVNAPVVAATPSVPVPTLGFTQLLALIGLLGLAMTFMLGRRKQ